jgi:MGT family glycosyltransferase
MTRIGIICPPVPSHIGTLAALGRELKQRGHSLTLFQIQDVESRVAEEGLEFCPIGEQEFAVGSLAEATEQLGKLVGLAALRFTTNCSARITNTICRDAPEVVERTGIELLLVDQDEPAGGTVAEMLGIPFVSVCSGLAINREVAIPPNFTAWDYQSSWWGILRNRIVYYLADRMIQPINQVLNQYRSQYHLPLIRYPDDTLSPLAQICQQPAEFDFPRYRLPKQFHYTGYFVRSHHKSIPFPYERLDNHPLIYASLGTLQNKNLEVFQAIAGACDGIEAQLVISLGSNNSILDLSQLPGNPIVVSYAPQLELLKRASLTITHGGLNTVLESLSCGVPMVAIPIANDQLGVGARLKWTGAAEVLSLANLTEARLKKAVAQVWSKSSYRDRAIELKQAMSHSGGVVKAAEIVEQVISTGKPVLRQ